MTTTDKLATLIQLLTTRHSVVVSVAKGRELVGLVVAEVGRCHTTCAARHTWRVEVEGAGTLTISVSTDAEQAEREGVYIALLDKPARCAPTAAPAPSPRAELIQQLRAQTAQILERTAPRKRSRQPSPLEVTQMMARALYGHPRRPEDGTEAYRRLRAS